MNLLCFGAGYSARRSAELAKAEGWHVAGTSTSDAGIERLSVLGMDGIKFDGTSAGDALLRAIADASHILVSVPPDRESGRDPVLAVCGEAIRGAAEAGQLKWIGYLSTIGVYGDHAGGWVDEITPPNPTSQRSIARLKVENAWRDLAEDSAVKLQILRLAAIYGPGLNPLHRLRQGTARRIKRPGQVFSRIHVDDIATTVLRGISGHGTETVYNVCDDLPAPSSDVIAYAAELLGMEPPPEVSLEEADLSPMARSFYTENKRCSNDRLKTDLGVKLAYPTYREGLRAILQTEATI